MLTTLVNITFIALAIDIAQVMVVEVVSMIEDNFQRSILTSQLHTVVHLVGG